MGLQSQKSHTHTNEQIGCSNEEVQFKERRQLENLLFLSLDARSGSCSQHILCFYPICDKGYGYRGNGLGHRLIFLQAGVKPGAGVTRDKGNLLALLHNSSSSNRVGRTQPLGRGCWEILTDKPVRILTVPATVCA